MKNLTVFGTGATLKARMIRPIQTAMSVFYRRPLARKLGLGRIGIHHERLPPGRRTSYPHAESDEEEFVYVLEGHPEAWINGYLWKLEPGDSVGFLPEPVSAIPLSTTRTKRCGYWSLARPTKAQPHLLSAQPRVCRHA
jgi:hypothetical protein